MSQRRKQALGRGLGALMGARSEELAPLEAPIEPSAGLRELELRAISPNPRQPRTEFNEERLNELASSIREHGVLQPILVAKSEANPDEFILLAGERRLRASQLAGLERIPARVVEATDVERLEFALIENVQRDDLNPVEEARAYEALINSFGYTQEQVSQRVGKSRVTVANSLRLLKLTPKCMDDLEEGKISAGHARAILMLAHPLQQEMLRKEIVDRELTVRQAEASARRMLQGTPAGGASPTGPGQKKSPQGESDLDVVALQERLTLRLGCRVSITTRSSQAGSIQIQYSSLDDLDRVLEILGIDVDD